MKQKLESAQAHVIVSLLYTTAADFCLLISLMVMAIAGLPDNPRQAIACLFVASIILNMLARRHTYSAGASEEKP